MTFFKEILVFLSVIAATVYWRLRKRMNYFKDLGILHIPPWPIIGNMGPVLLGKKHIFRVIQEVYDLHPDAKYVGFYNFMTPVIIIRDPNLMKSVTITNFNHFSDRCTFNAEMYKPFGIFFMRGDKWREARNILSANFSSNKLKFMFSIITDCAENVVNFVESEILYQDCVVYVKDIFGRYTSDVIASCGFGITLNTFQNPNNEFYVNGQTITNSEGIFNIKLLLIRSFPNAMKMLNAKIFPDKTINFFKSVITNVVEQRYKNNCTRPDLIQVLLDAKDSDIKKFAINAEDISLHCLSFFFAGYDTSSSLMSFIAHNLMKNPNVQSKLQDEVDEIMKKTNGKITYEDIQSMPYLEAVISETNRRQMAVFLERVCVKDFVMPPALPSNKSFVIKPGMTLFMSLHCIHSDPKFYDNPLKFDPDRVYENKCTNQTTSLSFGLGPRMCLGTRLALLKTKILFFHLMARYNLRPCTKSNMRSSAKKKIFSSYPQGKFWMQIEPRSKVL